MGMENNSSAGTTDELFGEGVFVLMKVSKEQGAATEGYFFF